MFHCISLGETISTKLLNIRRVVPVFLLARLREATCIEKL